MVWSCHRFLEEEKRRGETEAAALLWTPGVSKCSHELTTLSLSVATEELMWEFNAKRAVCVDDHSVDRRYLQFNHHVCPCEVQIRIAVCWVPAFVVHMDLKDGDRGLIRHFQHNVPE